MNCALRKSIIFIALSVFSQLSWGSGYKTIKLRVNLESTEAEILNEALGELMAYFGSSSIWLSSSDWNERNSIPNLPKSDSVDRPSRVYVSDESDGVSLLAVTVEESSLMSIVLIMKANAPSKASGVATTMNELYKLLNQYFSEDDISIITIDQISDWIAEPWV